MQWLRNIYGILVHALRMDRWIIQTPLTRQQAVKNISRQLPYTENHHPRKIGKHKPDVIDPCKVQAAGK